MYIFTYSKYFSDILMKTIRACTKFEEVLEKPLYSTGHFQDFWLTCDFKPLLGATLFSDSSECQL